MIPSQIRGPGRSRTSGFRKSSGHRVTVRYQTSQPQTFRLERTVDSFYRQHCRSNGRTNLPPATAAPADPFHLTTTQARGALPGFQLRLRLVQYRGTDTLVGREAWPHYPPPEFNLGQLKGFSQPAVLKYRHRAKKGPLFLNDPWRSATDANRDKGWVARSRRPSGCAPPRLRSRRRRRGCLSAVPLSARR
jgi:hypothetical protein